MKLLLFSGTRPNYIKVLPIKNAAEKLGVDIHVVDLMQHYDRAMRDVFISDIKVIVKGKMHSGDEAVQIARGIAITHEVLKESDADGVLIIGDTNSSLAATLAAVKNRIPTFHVEAGARVKIRTTENINRKIIDHVSDYNFAATPESLANLYLEGLKENSFLSYDVLYDAFLYDVERFGIKRKEEDLVLVTYHRRENLSRDKLRRFYEGLDKLAERYEVVFPMHPHTKKVSESLGLRPKRVNILEALERKGFLDLLSRAKLVITDSGGVVREATFMGAPALVPRDDLERKELIRYNTARLIKAGEDIERVANNFLSEEHNWKLARSAFGDGKASERIIKKIKELLRAYSFCRLPLPRILPGYSFRF